MEVNELFDLLQEEFNNDLKGELTLHNNCIVWTYVLDEDSEDDDYCEDDDFDFEATSPEELLLEVSDEDSEIIEAFLDSIEEIDNWNISEPKIKGKIISFKIL